MKVTETRYRMGVEIDLSGLCKGQKGVFLNRLLKPEEAAAALAVKPSTVREWLRTGRLKGVRLGRLWRVREEDLEAFVQEGGTDRNEERR